MKWFFKGKDGGPESNVTGYWLVECKSAVSIVLLRFDKGSREAYHSHAFNAISWVLLGWIQEHVLHTLEIYGPSGALGYRDEAESVANLKPSFKPIYTRRDRFHKVYGMADKTWVISIRGPWAATWREFLPKLKQFVTLGHGRVVMAG